MSTLHSLPEYLARLPQGWHATDPEASNALARELTTELCEGHQLQGTRVQVVADSDRRSIHRTTGSIKFHGESKQRQGSRWLDQADEKASGTLLFRARATIFDALPCGSDPVIRRWENRRFSKLSHLLLAFDESQISCEVRPIGPFRFRLFSHTLNSILGRVWIFHIVHLYHGQENHNTRC
jgi:hypothetical protein